MRSEEKLSSFQFCEEVNGIEHSYRITQESDHIFGVEKDGIVIAELTSDGHWLQLSGNPLSGELLKKIGGRIDGR